MRWAKDLFPIHPSGTPQATLIKETGQIERGIEKINKNNKGKEEERNHPGIPRVASVAFEFGSGSSTSGGPKKSPTQPSGGGGN